MLKRKLTNEYIRGLIEGEGSFTFTTSNSYGSGKAKIPAFQIKMHLRDKELIEGVRDYLGLKNKVYIYHYLGKDGSNRAPFALLTVREIGNLKNVIIPFFYGKLAGNKRKQFDEWLYKIGHDPMVPDTYRLLYRLHIAGYYEKNPLFKKFHVLHT